MADPGRERIRAQNLGAMIGNYQAAGARCLIVNGVVDPVLGVHPDLVPRAALTVCRLRAGRDEVARRFIARHGQRDDLTELLQEVRDEAGRMDASSFADACVDTSGVPAARVAELVCTAGYVDLGQIGFLSPAADSDPGQHRLKARNLAAIWRTYHAAGATHLIATGPVENEAVLRAYVEALPAAAVTLCRLHAGRADLTRRLMSRGEGGSWPQPGDPLRGQPTGYLARVADQAVAAAEALERAEVGAIRIDTDGHTVTEAADLIAAATS